MATGPVAIAAGREALSPLLTWRLQAGTFLEKYDGGPRIEAGRATVRFRFFLRASLGVARRRSAM
jgi:hypothetical protein